MSTHKRVAELYEKEKEDTVNAKKKRQKTEKHKKGRKNERKDKSGCSYLLSESRQKCNTVASTSMCSNTKHVNESNLDSLFVNFKVQTSNGIKVPVDLSDYKVLHCCVFQHTTDPKRLLVTEDISVCMDYRKNVLQKCDWYELEHEVFRYLHQQNISLRNGQLFIYRKRIPYWKEICKRKMDDIVHTQSCQLLHNKNSVTKLSLGSCHALLTMNKCESGMCACRICTVDPNDCFVYDEATETIELNKCSQHSCASHCCSPCIMFFVLEDVFHVEGPGHLIVQDDSHIFSHAQKWKFTNETNATILHNSSKKSLEARISPRKPRSIPVEGSIRVYGKSSLIWFSPDHTKFNFIQCKDIKVCTKSRVEIECVSLVPSESFVASVSNNSSLILSELVSLGKTKLLASDMSTLLIQKVQITPKNSKIKTSETSMVHLLECENTYQKHEFKEIHGNLDIE